MRFVGLSLVSGLCLLAANAASAGELRLTDNQMDGVTAGSTLLPAPFQMLNIPLVGVAAGELQVGLFNQYIAKTGENPRNDETMVFILSGLEQIKLDRLPPAP